MKYKRKQISVGIPIVSTDNTIFDFINKKQKEMEECLKHDFDYVLFTNPYRKYRRGKNRCLRCGVKIK